MLKVLFENTLVFSGTILFGYYFNNFTSAD